MADSWKAMDLNKFVVKDDMIDYVLHMYGSNWQVYDVIADDILDDLLKREWEKQKCVKCKCNSGHNPFQATFDESYDHNPFQVTSDDTSSDTLKSSFEDTCSSDCTWEQKKLLKNQGLDLPKRKKNLLKVNKGQGLQKQKNYHSIGDCTVELQFGFVKLVHVFVKVVVRYANPGQARQIKCYNCNGIGHITRNYTQPKRPQNSEYFKDKMLLMQAQENRVTLDEEQLLFIAGGQDNVVDDDVDEQPIQDLALNVDNVFQADNCDAFDSDVDEAPTAQTMFMANLSSADPVYYEAGPSYDSDVLSEVHDHDHYQDAVYKHHKVHEMHDDVQLNYVVDSHTGYTSDSNMIPYDQYVKDNTLQVVQSDVSATNVVDKSLTAKLATYKEQVEVYERRARFELTEIEQKIDDQLRIVITDRNIKEENLKKELHSVKMQLASTINHNKSMVEEVTSLKKDFKQKENQYLEEFLDMKALKEKVEDKLFKQDQSLQTIHMLCKLKPYYDEQRKAAIGYKNLMSPPCKAKIKEMKTIFDELEAEVDQNVVNRKCDEIERKNILIVNDTLIANCLSKEVFYIATNSELNVSRFSEMHEAHTVVQARCLELETELSTLKDKIQKDDHDVMDENLNVQINAKLKCVTVDSVTPKVLAPGMYAIDVEPIPPHLRNNREVHLDYLKHLKKSVATLREIVKEAKVVQIALWYLDSGCSKHMIGDRSWLRNFTKKFIETVRFENDHFGAIMGYEDYMIGDSVISRVYYVEGLGHNLFSVWQFYDSDLEVAFRKHSCYVRDTDGVEIIKGSRDSNLYTISVEDMMKSSPICLLSKASKTKSWLWHHRLNHLNFGTINDLARKDLVRGLPRLKFKKYHLCFACQLGKSKKHTHLPKAENTNLEVLNTLHMDLCGPMRVQTINGNK
uniref:Integrase, catalytic region, zinc finger, CCHC-type, peptidase aspartic, catalytic n=1 Tax=Tanacetum cinerariifolium TaxID=118510 RepID=A0A6L2MYX9_TANCI|nr:integrase, catalytic region, zinc finger, CCHC-type, peptidase aspartic, catalytic [Tanacetum cinerariifolium]